MFKNTIIIIAITVLSTIFASSCVEDEMYTKEEIQELLDGWDYSKLEEKACPALVSCIAQRTDGWGEPSTVNECEDNNYSRSCFECIYKETLGNNSCSIIMNNCNCPKDQVVDDDDDVSYATLCYFIRNDPDDDGCGLDNLSSSNCNSYMNDDSTFRNCIEDAYQNDRDCGDAYDCIDNL